MEGAGLDWGRGLRASGREELKGGLIRQVKRGTRGEGGSCGRWRRSRLCSAGAGETPEDWPCGEGPGTRQRKSGGHACLSARFRGAAPATAGGDERAAAAASFSKEEEIGEVTEG